MKTLNILGTGAIGSAIAAGAARTGVRYRIFTRKPCPPVTVCALDNTTIELEEPSDQPVMLTDNDILIFPLKAYQLASALAEWQPLLSPQTAVILLHNGMGGAELARDALPDNPVFLATTRMAALKQDNTHVKITGAGATDLGFITQGQKTALHNEVLSLMSRCLQEVTWHDNIYPSLWNKLSINAVINPLTALNDIPNGALTELRYQPQIAALCEEIAQVLNAQGIETDAESLRARILVVARATAMNFSSMHQDVAHQRQTEIEAINGYIVTQATKKGISVPENALLVNQITELTQR